MKKHLKRLKNSINIQEQFSLNRVLFYLVALLILFVPLYPKLPAIGVRNTWVYIRVEDFIIAGTTILFLLQLVRRKIAVYVPLGIPIVAYWIVGLLSLVFSLIFIAPHLANFFPHVAILSYLRRIEYMILFFIGFAAIKSEKDVKKLFWFLVAAATVVVLYGIGQRYYINVWSAFPDFFEKYSFCFPSFQTTNEEFAKGVPLCLPADGRITSLFGGHYDLSAYLVFVIPVILSVAFAIKGRIKQAFLALLGVGMIYLLILTASRISFGAYIIGIIFAFIFVKRKKFLIPILLISMFLLLTSSSSVLQRFTQTFRFTNLVVNSQGQVIGEALNKLPENLKNKISKEPVIFDAPPPTQELPTGSSYISLPGKSQATSSAILKVTPNLTKEQKSKYKFGAVEVSNVTGNFLVQRALVYDISFTTRFQGEWPVSWGAFERNPVLGSGYATITLSSDNSLLRALGEVGALGFIAFFSFFLVWYIYIRANLEALKPFERNFVIGLSAGIIGLCINALLIDVFEASKVAESMWLLLGVGAGAVAVTANVHISYLKEIKRVLFSSLFLMIYLLILFFIFLSSSFDNFFVADDFSWLKWAAQSDRDTLIKNFYDAQGFFLRPVDKLLIFGQYTLFSLKPFPYHLFNLFYNFGVSVAVYFLLYKIFQKKRIAFLGAFIFSFLPAHSQNLYWIATISTTVSSLFIMVGLLCFYVARQSKRMTPYILSLIFFLLSVFSYENAVIFIGLMALVDYFLVARKNLNKKKSVLLPYVISAGIIGLYLCVRVNAHAAGFSGDYNYNLAKVIPNAVGNYLGYAAMFFMSESSLSVYNAVRQGLKTYSMLLSVIGFLVIAFIGGFAFEQREKIHIGQRQKIFIFGFLFSVVALLPYLPLGNITLRYLYLGSFGFVVMVLVILEALLSKIKNKKYNIAAYVILAALLGTVFYLSLQKAEGYWDKASKITYDLMARFRLDYEIKNDSHIFFYNPPIRIGEAYIFPVGLPDAVHFINDNKTVKVFIVKDRKEAEALQAAVSSKVLHTYIFTFDKNFYLDKVSSTDKDEEKN